MLAHLTLCHRDTQVQFKSQRQTWQPFVECSCPLQSERMMCSTLCCTGAYANQVLCLSSI